MLDSNTKNLTANQRAVILNAIALDEKLNPALNDMAETGDSLANQLKGTQSEFKNLLITLGQNLLPIALEVVTTLNKMLEKFNQMSPAQQKVLLGFLALVAVAGPLLSALGTLVTIVSSLVGLFGAGGALAGAGAVLTGLGTAISTVAVPAVGALGAAMLPILAILAAVIATLAIFAVAWKFNLFDIQGTVKTVVSIIKSLWAALTAFLQGDTESAVEYLAEAWTTLTDKWQERWEKWFGWFPNAWQNFIQFMRDALGKLVSYIRDVFTRTDWAQVGKYILMGLANGMLLGIPSLIAAAALAADSVLDTIKNNLGISSPSAEAMKLGMSTAQGFLLGMQRVSPEDMARSLVRPITNTSSSQQQTIIQNFAGGVTISQVRSEIAQNNEQLMNTMIGALNG
jgi:hypothetical protein